MVGVMDKFQAMQRFIRVAQTGSFTRAADDLNLPKSSISSAVQLLERDLGTRLFHRSTRQVTLTEDGEIYLEKCSKILSDLDALESQFQNDNEEIRGIIRVDMPSRYASTVVLPHLQAWMDQYPHVQIKISSADYRVDLVKEGIDCVVRVGELADSALIARPLVKYHIHNCASPEYLKKYGVPQSIESLQDHHLIDYAPKLSNSMAMFEYVDQGETKQIFMESSLAVNGTDAYLSACLAGLGIAQMPAIGVQKHLEEGSLIRILPEFEAKVMQVSLIHSSRRQIPKRVSLFMDWLEILMKRIQKTHTEKEKIN
jgi:DNA-binding transcriptional LysR family regulator